jgi:hypothetical protein
MSKRNFIDEGEVVELADTTDLKSVELLVRAGSSPAFPTKLARSSTG